MLREYILIPRLFYYASNESIFDCNISLFLTLCCVYIYIYILVLPHATGPNVEVALSTRH